MGHFVESQSVEFEVRSLVNKTAILRAYTEIACDIKIEAAAINEGCLRLPISAIDRKICRWDRRPERPRPPGRRDEHWQL